MVAAGYLAPITKEFKAWDGYANFYDVAKQLAVSPDGETYVMPVHARHPGDLFPSRRSRKGRHFDRAAEDLEGSDRPCQAEIKAKTGAYGLLFPGRRLSWGGGAFDEGFQHLLVGSKTPQIAMPRTEARSQRRRHQGCVRRLQGPDRQGPDADAAAARA
jgi:multiple sugar transport system substrate-binding protein